MTHAPATAPHRLRAPDARRTRLARLALLALPLAAVCALSVLGLEGLTPTRGGLELAGEFFARALSPALEHEAAFVPRGTPPLLVSVLRAAVRTLVFAAAAMSLAVPTGLLLGFLLSRSVRADLKLERRPLLRALARLAAPAVRVVLVLLRSVHELLWAVILLAAFGLTPLAGVLALALPYAATLAKIYAELIDETSSRGARALDELGAAPVQAFFCGRLPAALPDLTTYTFYRFECCVRSSAVLGFFGFTTLGYYLAGSFENLHFGEVWTYLYALIALVLVLELAGRTLRGRFVG